MNEKNGQVIPTDATPNEKQQKVLPIENLKMLEEQKEGGFEGYGSPFHQLDSYGDIVMKGAYNDVIERFLEDGFNVDSHDWSYRSAIGFPTEAREDDYGLFFRSVFHGTEDAQQVRQKMKERAAAGKKIFFSIGYYIKEAEILTYEQVEEKLSSTLTAAELEKAKAFAGKYGRVRLLKKIDLAEVSVVLRPAAMGAYGTGVKSADGGEQKTESESEIPAATQKTENKSADDRPDGQPLEVRQAVALAAVDDIIASWKDISDLQVKEGRAISESRRRRIKDLRDTLAEGVKELDALLAETEPKKDEEEKSDDGLWLQLERARATRLKLLR